MPTALILVAGGPGAGKTSVGRALAQAIPSSVLLDKDVIASPWLDPLLARLNDGTVDRDSRVYWDTLRPLEYASLMAAAYDNVAVGKTAIVVAPFGPELRDPEWTDACRARAATLGARLVVAWIAIGPGAARERIAQRNDARDAWKLANWNAFSATDPYAPPHHAASARTSSDGTASDRTASDHTASDHTTPSSSSCRCTGT